jgi:lysozyme
MFATSRPAGGGDTYARLTDEGLARIKRFEGFSATPYLCPAGWWTIGFGAVRDPDGQPVTAATAPVTEEAAEGLLRRDVALAERAVLRLISVPLADGQFDALVSFTFNLGLARSSVRRSAARSTARSTQTWRKSSGSGYGEAESGYRGFHAAGNRKRAST